MQPAAQLAATQTRLARNVARLSGRDPHGFEVRYLSDGSLCVRCANAAAFYPVEGWLSKFSRHLQNGYFDSHPVQRPSAAEGST